MKTKNKKALTVTIITAILMIVIEALMLYMLHNKLSGESYQFIGLNFKNILIGEIIILVLIEIVLTLTFLYKKYKINNFICAMFLIVVFSLIAFNFHSYGNFINTCILYIYTLYLKKIITKK